MDRPRGPDAKKEDGKDKTDAKSDEKPKAPPVVEPVRIDFDGLAYRILDLPVPEAELSDLQPGEAGQIFFLRNADEKAALQRFDLKDRKTRDAPARRRGLCRSPPTRRSCSTSVKDELGHRLRHGEEDRAEGGEGQASTRSRCKIDPRAEWPEIFEEAWRINRDYFYDPQHARGGLEGDAREVRAVPPARWPCAPT